jgi:hypothetical protein
VRGSQGPPNATLSGPPGARGHEKRHPDYFSFFLGLQQRGEAKEWSRGEKRRGGREGQPLPKEAAADEGRCRRGPKRGRSGTNRSCDEWPHERLRQLVARGGRRA